jgi:hypothetical protein
MPDTTVATEYLRDLEQRREAYRSGAIGELQKFFKRRERKPPEEFHDSSFLYIRSYDADLGVRPFGGIVFWHSPDLTVSPASSVGTYTTTLNAGEDYVIRCVLRNRGDLGVPSAKVELFLTDPTLGFDTRFATNLTLGRVPSAWVPAGGSAATDFLYTVPPTEAGHKCLFARAFSFSPLDLPIDDFNLDPLLDRHVAQQNLNIVGQAQAFAFNLVHFPNANVRIALKPLETEELLGLRHPVLADVRPAKNFPRRGWGRLANIKLNRPGSNKVDVADDDEGIAVKSSDSSAIDLGTQRKLITEVRGVLTAVGAGQTKMAAHRDLFRKFRQMTAEGVLSSFTMQIPNLALPPKEAVGLNITATDQNLDQPNTIGGITLIIVGS